uniref:Uncharacterized protein n=1 Tax=Amphimedon queenslandica TaxID=400682 RepID=A0A1X7SHM5_AMPQE
DFSQALGPTNPRPIEGATRNPSPLRPSRFSLEYLLLPPRSAPAAATPRLASKASALTAATLLLVSAS